MSLLFNGAYANPDTPLWLSALGPNVPPNNLQVSTLTVNPDGGIAMISNGQAYPNTYGAPIAFNRDDNLGSAATELRQSPSKQVPTKAVETTYLASVTAGGAIYDDLALNGLQIYGPQIVDPTANSGCAGYLTQGDLPFSIELHTGRFTTPNIYANTINASIGNFSTVHISSGTFAIPDPLTISTLNASTVNSGNVFVSSLTAQRGYISSLNSSEITTSTLNVSSFSLGNAINIENITASTITAGIGNFSTLNAPGFSEGGGIVTTSSIFTSSLTAGLVSTSVGVMKEIFTSSMTFNAAFSPNFDLGLGGLIGGVAGGFAANGLALGLGGAALATGIASIAIARTSGGIHPDVFQTVNGTSQLQFSTVGLSTTGTIFSKFVDTDSFNPQHVPGFPVITQTPIPAGTYCMRTVSDPLNLANSSGVAGQGIQGFSEWTPVYPGSLQVQSNALSSILTGNSLNLGTYFGDSIHVKPAPGKTIYLEGPTAITGASLIVQGSVNATSVVSPNIIGSLGNFSTLNVSTFVIGNVQYQNFVASTVTTSTLNVTGITNYNSLQPISPGTSLIQTAQLNATSGVATNQLTCQGTGVFTSTVQAPSLIGISSINGQPYGGPVISTFQTLTTLGNTALAIGGGNVAIGNGAISVPTFVYGDLYSRSLQSISTSWMAPNPPVAVPTSGLSTFPSGTFVLSGLRVMWGYYSGMGSQPTIAYVPNFSATPCITLTCDASLVNNGIVANVFTNSASGCWIRIINATLGTAVGVGVYWMAIGPA